MTSRDYVAGQCDCQAQMMGRRCDQCAFGFYRFPQCAECRCDVAGTVPRVCDPDNGQCLCKVRVRHQLLLCLNMYLALVISDTKILNVEASRCRYSARAHDMLLTIRYQSLLRHMLSVVVCAQENVIGQQCDRCVAGTYYLEERNPQGCTSCFCFGQSTQCYESSLRRTQVRACVVLRVESVQNTGTRMRSDT